jgi:hypothetical protein
MQPRHIPSESRVMGDVFTKVGRMLFSRVGYETLTRILDEMAGDFRFLGDYAGRDRRLKPRCSPSIQQKAKS